MGLFRRRKEKGSGSGPSEGEKKELSLNLSDLDFLSILNLTEESKKRVNDAREMLKKKALEICGTAPGSDEFKDIVRMQTLVSSDPKTAELISQAKRTYRCVYGLKVSMGFSKKEIGEMIESSKSVYGSWADGMRSKLSNAINK
jgi:TFIIF-interacting CTD phosphatase-like protein